MIEEKKSLILELPYPYTESVTLDEVRKGFELVGCIGETDNAPLSLMAITAGVSVGVISLSGSGKSILGDAVFNHFFPEELAYKGSSSSDKGFLEDAREINTKKAWYIEELQRAMSAGETNKEILKKILEGKPYERKKQMVGKRQPVLQKINPIPIYFTIAIENENETYNEAEFSRRQFIVLNTDISQEQNKRVKQYKAKMRTNLKFFKETVTDAHIKKKITDHVKFVLQQRNLFFVNPFAEYLATCLGNDEIRIRSKIDTLYNVIDISAKWNQIKRITDKNEFKDRTGKKWEGVGFIEIEDLVTALELYGDQFNKDLYHLPMLGTDLIAVMKEQGAKKGAEGLNKFVEVSDEFKDEYELWSLEMLSKKFRKSGKKYTKSVLYRQLEILVEGQKVSKEKVGNEWYYKLLDDSIIPLTENINIHKAYQIGVDIMKEHYSDIADEWISRCEKQLPLITELPKTKIETKQSEINTVIKETVEDSILQ